MQFIRKIQKNGRIVIPKYIRDDLNINKKDIVVFEIRNNELYIRKEK